MQMKLVTAVLLFTGAGTAAPWHQAASVDGTAQAVNVNGETAPSADATVDRRAQAISSTTVLSANASATAQPQVSIDASGAVEILSAPDASSDADFAVAVGEDEAEEKASGTGIHEFLFNIDTNQDGKIDNSLRLYRDSGRRWYLIGQGFGKSAMDIFITHKNEVSSLKIMPGMKSAARVYPHAVPPPAPADHPPV